VEYVGIIPLVILGILAGWLVQRSKQKRKLAEKASSEKKEKEPAAGDTPAAEKKPRTPIKRRWWVLAVTLVLAGIVWYFYDEIRGYVTMLLEQDLPWMWIAAGLFGLIILYSAFKSGNIEKLLKTLFYIGVIGAITNYIFDFDWWWKDLEDVRNPCAYEVTVRADKIRYVRLPTGAVSLPDFDFNNPSEGVLKGKSAHEFIKLESHYLGATNRRLRIVPNPPAFDDVGKEKIDFVFKSEIPGIECK